MLQLQIPLQEKPQKERERRLPLIPLFSTQLLLVVSCYYALFKGHCLLNIAANATVADPAAGKAAKEKGKKAAADPAVLDPAAGGKLISCSFNSYTYSI